MKFLYCPQCKQLHVKPWYSIRNRCVGCFGDARLIEVPNSWMTYTTYILYVIIPILVVFYVTSHTVFWIYGAIALLVVMIAIAYRDIVRGERLARARIKVTEADSSKLRARTFN